MNVLFYLTMTLFVIVCLFLVLLILIQKGRGGGLASAFGGAGGQTAFGSKTGDVLTWATSIVFGIFMLLAVALNLICNHIDDARAGIAANVAPATNHPLSPNDAGSDLPKAPIGDPGAAPKPPAGLSPPSTGPSLPPVTSTEPAGASSTLPPTSVPALPPAVVPSVAATLAPATQTQPISAPSTSN